MKFLYGDRELRIEIGDLLTSQVDVIVNSARSDLSHNDGLAARILSAAGEIMLTQSKQLVQEYGSIESGMAVYTAAGDLPYKAIIHAIGPVMGEGDEQQKIEQAVLRSLLLCETNDWHSIAFPAISVGSLSVPVETCAKAFFRSITHFWDARQESAVEKVIIYLLDSNFHSFFDAFRDDAISSPENDAPSKKPKEAVGYIELNEEEHADIDNEIADWFK